MLIDHPAWTEFAALTLERIATARSEHVFHFGAVAVVASRKAPLNAGLIEVAAAERRPSATCTPRDTEPGCRAVHPRPGAILASVRQRGGDRGARRASRGGTIMHRPNPQRRSTLVGLAAAISTLSLVTAVAERTHGGAHVLESLGTAVPRAGIPTTNMWSDGGLLYIEAVDPQAETKRGPFVAYDVAQRRVVYSGNEDIHTGFRCIAVDRDGNAYFSVNETGLAKYDPRANTVTVLPVRLSASLRAATRQAADGWIYGATNTPDNRLFRFRPQTNELEDIGTAWGYTTSMVLDPTERYVYFVPGAHGNSFRMGTPVVRFDVATREPTVVAFLNDFYENTYGFRLGGTYALDLDREGRRLFINMNAVDLARDPAARSGFGDPAVFVVHLPEVPEPGGGGAGARFVDVSAASGISATLAGAYLHTSSWGDVDGDGWPDLYAGTFVQGSAQVPGKLLLNRRGAFVDSGQAAVTQRGRASGSVLADFDGDRDLDLFVSHNRITGMAGPLDQASSLFRNDGGQLVDVTAGSGIDAQSTNGRQAGVLDVDDDGDLDLFVVADALRGRGPTVLLRNDGGLRFSDATAALGLPPDIQGLGLAIGDVTGDGRPDLFVAGGPRGAAHRNYLFVQQTDGRYRRASDAVLDWAPYVVGDEDWVSGAAFGDVDRDGRLDLLVGHHFGSAAERGGGAALRLYLNRGLDPAGDPVFEDVTAIAGLPPIVSKAPHVEIQDFDNDGWPDLYASVAVGGKDGVSSPQPLVFYGMGLTNGRPTFKGPALAEPTYYAGGPVADYNRDGRLDVFLADWRAVLVGTEDEPEFIGSRLMANAGPAGNWLAVAVDDGRLPMGIGAQVRVYRAGGVDVPAALLGMDEIGVGDGFSGSGQALAHFGLGDEDAVDVVAQLPFGGARFEARSVSANQRLTLPGGQAEPEPHLGLRATAVRDRSAMLLEAPAAAMLPPHAVAAEPPTVDFVAFPRPAHAGNPWSQWGAGLVASDGRFYAAIGDHLGRDGNAYVYRYDPEARVIMAVGDVQTAVGHVAGHWGHGKIHSAINEGADGFLYMTSYWGTTRNLVFDEVYEGSVVLRYGIEGGVVGAVPTVPLATAPSPSAPPPTASSPAETPAPTRPSSPATEIYLPLVVDAGRVADGVHGSELQPPIR